MSVTAVAGSRSRSGGAVSDVTSTTWISWPISFGSSSRWSTRPRTTTTASSLSLWPCSAIAFGNSITSMPPCRSSSVNEAHSSPFREYLRARLVTTPPTSTWSPS